MTISSTANAQVKRIRGLKDRKQRSTEGCFFVEGIRLVAEALQLDAPIEKVVVAPDLLRSEFALDLVIRAETQGIEILEVTADVFQTLSTKDGPQGLAAVARQRWTRLEDSSSDQGLCWVALDSVQDPGNLGCILRVCEAVGAAGVMLVGDCTDPFDPNCIRASMGAIFSQRLVKTGMSQLLSWTSRHQAVLVGASGAAATAYRDAKFPDNTVLLMGSEREGLSVEQLKVCDMQVHVPMVGRADSLNLAVATGILVYEIFHQNSAE